MLLLQLLWKTVSSIQQVIVNAWVNLLTPVTRALTDLLYTVQSHYCIHHSNHKWVALVNRQTRKSFDQSFDGVGEATQARV